MKDTGLQYGFTLLEVMISLAILSIALSAVIGVNIGAMSISGKSKGIIIAASLARSKMFDIEEELRIKGFPDFDEQLEGDFDAEGHPDFKWVAQIIKIKLPNYSAPKEMASATGQNQGTSSLGISPTLITPEMSAAMAGLPIFLKQIEDAIREVKVTVLWLEQEREKSLTVTTHFVNIPGMEMGVGQDIVQQVPGGSLPARLSPSTGSVNLPRLNTGGALR
ncbi:MAG: prepilin-type N-terminal cleavage/methylation domain-containing protein [Deltaproteobacteria bacterium]|nr:prepilin-type N-terminal cleavage/methylation domain-containing protein [Deltaproteobacteria bacterium]